MHQCRDSEKDWETLPIANFQPEEAGLRRPKDRRANIPWAKVTGIGNVLRHDYDRVAPDVLWKLAQDDLPLLESICRDELRIAVEREANEL